MKQVNGYEVKEFTYSSRTERDNHVALMKEEGWYESGQVKRLKEGVSLFYANDNDREWYARFHRPSNLILPRVNKEELV